MPTVVTGVDSRPDEPAPWLDMLRAAGFEFRIAREPRLTLGLCSEQETIQLLSGAAAVIAGGEPYTEHILSSLPELRVVARLGVGFDRVDIAAATKHGIAVTITPDANHESVAEHALALMLAVARYIVPGDRGVRAGGWQRRLLMPLRGKTLGIVGLGRIGRSLAVRALAMRMNVIATEPCPDKEFVDKHGIQLLDLDMLLGRSDVVSIHVLLNDHTRGMINAEKLAKMKPGSLLVNTARGGVVVQADLVDALRSGRLGGAGLDVFEPEPTDATNPLFQFDNVVSSPHNAGTDTLAIKDMGIAAAQCIIDLSRGHWPHGSVVNDELKEQWQW